MSGFETIPGETPLDDISGLLPPNVRTRARLNEVEAENVLEALTKYLGGTPGPELAPFDLDWCYQLHAEMFGRVWIWAGSKRTVPLNLGVPPYRIDPDLQTLLDDLKYWDQHNAMPLAEQAAHLHHRAVVIHPFMNGNGRLVPAARQHLAGAARAACHRLARRCDRWRERRPHGVP